MFLYLGAKWKIVNTDINFEYGTPTYAYLPLQKRKRKKRKEIYIYIYICIHTHPCVPVTVSCHHYLTLKKKEQLCEK